jgi:hypothetical protein
MKQTPLLLVVSESGSITNEARATRRALYQAAADKIGAELLVTAEGCHAQLLEVPLLTPVPVAEQALLDDMFVRYSEKTREAFRVVEAQLNQGKVKLVRDRWSQGALRFLSPTACQPSALLPVDRGGFTLVESADLKGKRFCPGTLLIGGIGGVAFSAVVALAVRLAGL